MRRVVKEYFRAHDTRGRLVGVLRCTYTLVQSPAGRLGWVESWSWAGQRAQLEGPPRHLELKPADWPRRSDSAETP